MGRLKAMVKSALEDRSPRFMLATIALGVVVALLAGFAIGYKVDNSNGGGSGGKRTATRPKAGKGGKPAARLKAMPLLTGAVAGVTAKQVIVLDPASRRRFIGIGPKTRIMTVDAAKASDIKVGSRVLFQPSTTSKTTALEVVVLPPKARVGWQVTAVKTGSMTVKSLGGTQNIKTSDAVVRKTGVGYRQSIVKGDKVVVKYFAVRGRRTQATDLLVLPKDSKFQ